MQSQHSKCRLVVEPLFHYRKSENSGSRLAWVGGGLGCMQQLLEQGAFTRVSIGCYELLEFMLCFLRVLKCHVEFQSSA